LIGFIEALRLSVNYAPIRLPERQFGALNNIWQDALTSPVAIPRLRWHSPVYGVHRMEPATVDSRRIMPSKTLPTPRFRYSPVVQAGPFVFVSGMVGLDAETGALDPGGAYGQTARVLANVKALATEMGWHMDQLVVARVYCADATGAGEVNRAWDAAFTDIEPPARTFVTVSALPLGAAVEIEFQFLLSGSPAA
jgi:2-iminobutanoate/2-iminopropanoate deaminase